MQTKNKDNTTIKNGVNRVTSFFVMCILAIGLLGTAKSAFAEDVIYSALAFAVLPTYTPPDVIPPAYQPRGCYPAMQLDPNNLYVTAPDAQSLVGAFGHAVEAAQDSNSPPNCYLEAEPPQNQPVCEVQPTDGSGSGYATCTLLFDMFMEDTGEELPQSVDFSATWSCSANSTYSSDAGGCVPSFGAMSPTNTGCDCATAGDPVNLSTGNVTQTVSDFSGSGDFPLEVVRYFSANTASQAAKSNFFGEHWRLNYDRALNIYTQSNGNKAVNAERENGQIFQFLQSTPGGPWTATSNINAKLAPQTDLDGNITGWSYSTAENDTIEEYDAQGRLSWIQNRAGLRQIFNRDANGRLLSVSDPFGRLLGFEYDTSTGLLSSITQPGGGVIYYTYTQSTVNFFAPRWLLASTQYPDGHSTTAIYNESTHTNGANAYDFLTGVIDENGQRFQTFDYVGTQPIGLPSSASGSYLGSGFNHETFSYLPGFPPGAAPTTTYTDANGAARVYAFTGAFGFFVPATASQPGTPSTPSASVSTTYDSNGNPSKWTDYNGNVSCFQYDLTRNLEIVRLEGLPPLSACPTDLSSYVVPATPGATVRKISTQWSTNWRLPTGFASAKRIKTIVYDTKGVPSSVTIQPTSDATGTLGFAAPQTGTPRTWGFVSNANGQITQITGPRTDLPQVSQFSYYPTTEDGHRQGDLASSTNSLGQATTFDSYDAVGRLLQSTDPTGLRTNIAYTPRGRISSIVRSTTIGSPSSSETTTFGYDYVGNLIKTTFPDGSWISQSFDDAHRLIGRANSAGETISYTLNNAGLTTQTQILDASSTLRFQETSAYDILGKLVSAVGLPNEDTTWTHDPQGNALTQSDALGNTTTTEFDALNREKTIQMPSAAFGGANPTTQIVLDLRSRLASLIDPRSLTTSQTVDGLDNATAEQSPDSGEKTASYDAAGNVISSIDARGKTTNYSYDSLDRMILASYQSGSPSTIQYDGGVNPAPYSAGHLTYFSDESGQTTFTYDAYGRLAEQAQTTASTNTSAQTQSIGWGYSENPSLPGSTGHLTDISLSGLTAAAAHNGIHYAYDVSGRVNEVDFVQDTTSTVIASDISWTPMGKPQGWTWGNGSSFSRQFDLDGRLSQYPLGVLTGSGTLSPTPNALSRVVSYDLAGRISAFTHTDGSGSSTSAAAQAANQNFIHDGLDRLAGFTPSTTGFAPLSAESYGYDLSGNRASFGVGSNTYLFTTGATSNQLTGISGGPIAQSLSYDAAGNLLSDGVSSWTYSDRGRMATASNVANGTWNYFYNAQGFRTLKEGPNGAAVRYLRDTSGHLLGEFDASGNMQEEIVWLGDMPLAVITPPSTGATDVRVGYIFSDQINTPRVVVRATDNAMLWSWIASDPFGRVSPNDNPQGIGSYPFDLRLPGQIHDSETGLDHNPARDYDAAIGRFVQADPQGWAGSGVNLYAYANNSPLNTKDIAGQTAIPEETEKFDCGAGNGCGNFTGQHGGFQASSNEAEVAGPAAGDAPEKFTITNPVAGGGICPPGAPTTTQNGSTTLAQGSRGAQTALNRAQGKAFEKQIGQQYPALNAPEVTVRTNGDQGVRLRLDFLGKGTDNTVVCVECKSSATAPLTPNQTTGFPEMETHGATVLGAGKPGFPGGTVIPPTPIQIIRPGDIPAIP